MTFARASLITFVSGIIVGQKATWAMGGPYCRVLLMFRRISRQLDVVSAKLSALLDEVKAPHAIGNTVYLSTAQGTTVNALKILGKPVGAEEISAITH